MMKVRLLRDESCRAVHVSKRWTCLGTREDTGKYLTKRFQTPENSTPAPCTSERLKRSVHSLLGAALLRTGWSSDLSLLEKPCLVIKA